MNKEYYTNVLKKKFNTHLYHMIFWFIGSGIFAGCMLKYDFDRQFYEQDPNLSYYSTNSDIVSDTNLYIINIIPVCCILILILGLSKPNELIGSKIKEIFIILLLYFLTIGINIFITEILKKFISKPRPSVFYLCNYQGYRDGIQLNNLTDYYSLTNRNNLANTDLCWDKSALPGAVSSFPSGHTSLSFCSQTFLVIFLIRIFEIFEKSTYLRIYNLSKLNFLAYVPYILAGWIAISRIYDYKHNEVDLIGGFIVGCAVGYFGSVRITNIYKKLEIYEISEKFNNQQTTNKNEFVNISNLYNSMEYNEV
jgi:membrane-associated phospholipid phosphatase